MHVGVIGAGLSGLAAARTLHDAGHRVTVFEKSRGLGGRLATRRIDGFAIDHGAPAIDAPGGTALADTLARLMGGDTVELRPVPAGRGRPPMDEPRAFADGLTAFAKRLAEGLDVHHGMRVGAIRDAGPAMELGEEQGNALGTYDRIVLSAPAPQAVDLLERSPEPASRVEALRGLEYDPAVVLLMGIRGAAPGAWFTTSDEGPLESIVCEAHKGRPAVDGIRALALRFEPEWSRKLLDGAADEEVTDTALRALRTRLGIDVDPEWRQVKRWRYGVVRHRGSWDDLNPSGSRVVLCGDALSAPGMANTFASGIAAAERLIAEAG